MITAKDAVVKGRRIRYVDVGDGPPLLLVHGTGGSWSTWSPNISQLARRHRVIAVDLPGCGDSELIEPPRDMSVYADHVAALLRMLGCGPTTVVGHSLGGLVCLQLALRHPDQVDKMVLVDSGGVEVSGTRRFLLANGLRCAHLVVSRFHVTDVLARYPSLLAPLLRFAFERPKVVSEGYIRTMLETMRAPGVAVAIAAGVADGAIARLQEIDTRTLLIWGESDKLLPLGLGRQMADIMQNAELVTIERSGHCPNVEQARVFNKMLLDWTGKNP